MKTISKLDLNKDEVKRCRARVTGTIVSLIDCGKEYPDGRWMTVCETHGGCINHDSRKLAMQWLSHPDEWCPVCQGYYYSH